MIRRPPRSTLFPYTRSSDLDKLRAGAHVVALYNGIEAEEGDQAEQIDSLSVIHLGRSEEHTSELQSQSNLVCRLLLEKKKKPNIINRPGRAHHRPRG